VYDGLPRPSSAFSCSATALEGHRRFVSNDRRRVTISFLIAVCDTAAFSAKVVPEISFRVVDTRMRLAMISLRGGTLSPGFSGCRVSLVRRRSVHLAQTTILGSCTMRHEELVEYVRYLEAKLASLEARQDRYKPVEGYVFVSSKRVSDLERHGDDGPGGPGGEFMIERRKRQEDINRQRNSGRAREKLEAARAEVKARFDREGRTIEGGQISAADIERAVREILGFVERHIDSEKGRVKIHEFDSGGTHCEVYASARWENGPKLEFGIECNF